MKGHIRRRGERSWEIKFDVGTDPSTGRRKTRYASFKGTKREAEAELTRRIAAYQSGNDVDPSRITLDAFFDRWETDWAALNVSPKTGERYKEILRLHVRPHLGKLPIQKLRALHLSELYSKLLRSERNEGGLASRTVGHVHRVLHRALGHAVQWAIVQSNVASNVSPPPVASTEIEILRPDALKLAHAKLKGREIHPIFLTAIGTGMRRGEILALRWQDVDLDRGTLRVERSLEQTKAGMRFKAPKTKHGRRTVALPGFLVAELRARWKQQMETRLALGLGKASDESLVFCHPDGQPLTPNGLTWSWHRAARSIGLTVTFHSLRHTHASRLIASGMDVLTISRRLGHGTPSVTLSVYGHLFSDTDDRAAKAIDAVFSSAGTE